MDSRLVASDDVNILVVVVSQCRTDMAWAMEVTHYILQTVSISEASDCASPEEECLMCSLP
jgi:hypothetical protein